MAEIISIKKLRENSNPDIFIETVLNSPSRLQRLEELRKKRLEEAKREAERLEREKAQQEEFNGFCLKLAVGFAFLMTIFATYVALAF